MEETISLQEIFQVIKKRLVLIISLIIVFALVSGIVSYYVLTPTYQSSSQFIVNQSQDNKQNPVSVNDIKSNVEIINTYNVIIKSPAILDKVISDLDLNITAQQLQDKLDVSSAENSQVVTVKATDTDPVMATNIANGVVKTFQKKIPSIMNVDNVKVLSKAVTKDQPSQVSPRPMLNIAIALVLGAMLGVGLAFLLEYLDNTIKDEDDITKRFGIPVLGVISHIDEKDVKQEAMINPALSRVQRGSQHGTQKKTS